MYFGKILSLFRAVTSKVNFTKIIDQLWYSDVNKLKKELIDDFQVFFFWFYEMSGNLILN